MTPLERAKAAIAQTLGYSEHPIEAFALADGRMVSADAIARAVIAAIRNAPDDTYFMMAGEQATPERGDKAVAACSVWTAMIDAILAGGE